MPDDSETIAGVPLPVIPDLFNPGCALPYGLEVEHIRKAMFDFIEFLEFINLQLHAKGMPRLEMFLMPASFSSIVGEFANLTIPRYCSGLVKNKYHNGHPDLIPTGIFLNDAVRYTHDGIEVKGSRHGSGWQGHNPEAIWLMVY